MATDTTTTGGGNNVADGGKGWTKEEKEEETAPHYITSTANTSDTVREDRGGIGEDKSVSAAWEALDKWTVDSGVLCSTSLSLGIMPHHPPLGMGGGRGSNSRVPSRQNRGTSSGTSSSGSGSDSSRATSVVDTTTTSTATPSTPPLLTATDVMLSSTTHTPVGHEIPQSTMLSVLKLTKTEEDFASQGSIFIDDFILIGVSVSDVIERCFVRADACAIAF